MNGDVAPVDREVIMLAAHGDVEFEIGLPIGGAEDPHRSLSTPFGFGGKADVVTIGFQADVVENLR